MRLKDYKAKVRIILRDYPETRNSDTALVARFIHTYLKQFVTQSVDGYAAVELRKFMHLPPINSITRARRIIQNDDGEFLPTIKAVREKRRIKEEDYRNWEVREAKGI